MCSKGNPLFQCHTFTSGSAKGSHNTFIKKSNARSIKEAGAPVSKRPMLIANTVAPTTNWTTKCNRLMPAMRQTVIG